ncbi:hypothetical protein D3C83_09490 [compost metagenome]
MTDHSLIESIFEKTGESPDLLFHYRRRILDQVRLITEIIVGQRFQRWGIPGVQMHPHFTGVASDHVAREFDESIRQRHFVIGQVNRLEPEPLAQLLKTRQVRGVAGGDLPRFCPEMVSFGVNRDDEGDLRHAALRTVSFRLRRHSCA